MAEFPPPPITQLTPSTQPTRTVRAWIIVAAVVLACLAIGSTTMALSQTHKLNASRAQASNLQAQVADLQTQVQQAIAATSGARAEATDAETKLTNAQNRLIACAQAETLSVKMDKLQHKLLSNALFNGSVSSFIGMESQYKSLGRQWKTAANRCDPSGGYTFG
jgi:outer membrane murein-binding lipoprotein Lpp